jgi:hypothetical protein
LSNAVLEERNTGAAAPRAVKIRTRVVAALLFLGLLLAYHANWTEMIEGDTFGTLNIPYQLMKHGRLSFDPETHPHMFKWHSKPPLIETNDFQVRRWDEIIGDRTAAQWRVTGHLSLNEPRYFIVYSELRDTYVNTFGPIPGILLLPFAAIVSVIDPAVSDKLLLRLSIAKLSAAVFVAGCAVLLFLAARRHVPRGQALLIAAAYGLGTCAWSTSSQTLWQQTVNQFLLVFGAYCYLQNADKRVNTALAGLAFGAATAARATAVVMLAAVLVYLWIHHRRRVLFFLIGAVPVPALIALYNWYYFGSPFVFAQELVGHMIAAEKTGSPELWQTPLFKGFRGLLFSPSRGLLVFSPFLALAFWGMVRIWRDAEFRAHRPLVVATLVMMAIQSKWFDWWGGWTYGYRPWLEVTPFLVLFIVPVLGRVMAKWELKALAGVALAWSIFVQALGAFSYDRTWNEREHFLVQFPTSDTPTPFLHEERAHELAEERGGKYLGPTLCNIDISYCRRRLWSWEDSIILYQITHFAETRARRSPVGWRDLEWAPRL